MIEGDESSGKATAYFPSQGKPHIAADNFKRSEITGPPGTSTVDERTKPRTSGKSGALQKAGSKLYLAQLPPCLLPPRLFPIEYPRRPERNLSSCFENGAN